jgi:hypothetical protein
MNELCSNFEIWTVDDGHYPPLRVGMTIELVHAFQRIKYLISNHEQKYLEQESYTQYSFCGEVIRVYDNLEDYPRPLLIINAGIFNFLYLVKNEDSMPEPGQYIRGFGEIGIDSDYPFWIYEDFKDLPRIHYLFKVNKITGIIYPDSAIFENEDVVFCKTSFTPDEYNELNLVDVEDMNTDESGSGMYLIDLELIK